MLLRVQYRRPQSTHTLPLPAYLLRILRQELAFENKRFWDLYDLFKGLHQGKYPKKQTSYKDIEDYLIIQYFLVRGELVNLGEESSLQIIQLRGRLLV